MYSQSNSRRIEIVYQIQSNSFPYPFSLQPQSISLIDYSLFYPPVVIVLLLFPFVHDLTNHSSFLSPSLLFTDRDNDLVDEVKGLNITRIVVVVIRVETTLIKRLYPKVERSVRSDHSRN